MAELVYGINPVLEVLKRNPEVVEEVWLHKRSLKGKRYQILELAKKHRIKTKVINKDRFNPPGLSPEAVHQGVVAYLRYFDYSDLEDVKRRWESLREPGLVICIDEVEDPRNLGAIIRSADAAGVHGVVIPKLRSSQVTSTVVKASSGAVFNIPIARVTNLKHAINFFKNEGLWVVGLTHKAEEVIYKLDLKLPLVLIVGNEARGIRPSLLEMCDFKAKIPMKGKIESLNASVAAGIALFEVLRQREFSN